MLASRAGRNCPRTPRRSNLAPSSAAPDNACSHAATNAHRLFSLLKELQRGPVLSSTQTAAEVLRTSRRLPRLSTARLHAQ